MVDIAKTIAWLSESSPKVSLLLNFSDIMAINFAKILSNSIWGGNTAQEIKIKKKSP